jgi:WD40 repeat protein
MWYIPSAENRVTLTLNAEEKVLAVSFVSAIDLELEGKYIWASIDRGELIEIDCVTGTRAAKNLSHSAPITLILKSRSEMYTLDENGSLKIWSSDSEGRISLNNRPRSLRVQSKVCFAVVVDQSVIWTAQPKMIEVYSLDENVPNLLLKKHEVSFGIANITCITFGPELRYILTGHEDGKITIFDADTVEKIKVLQISTYKITSILVVRKHIWVGFGTGKISIFDIDSNGMWIAILEFLAYPSTGVIQLILDDACSAGTSMYSSVMSLSENGHIRIWDGLLINFQIGNWNYNL